MLGNVCVLLLIVLRSAAASSAQQLQQEGDDVKDQATDDRRFDDDVHPLIPAPALWQDKESLALCQSHPKTGNAVCFDAEKQYTLIHAQLRYALQAYVRSLQLNSYRQLNNGGQSDDDRGQTDKEHELTVPLNCHDIRPQSCPERAAKGDCQDPQNILYMQAHCPVSCGTCHNRTKLIYLSELLPCTNKHDDEEKNDDDEDEDGNNNRQETKKKLKKIKESLQQRRRENEHTPFSKGNKYKLPILDAEASDLGVPQVMPHSDRLALRLAVKQKINEARDYMHHVRKDDFYKIVRETCRNKEPYCTLWAVEGECENNADYMRKKCAPVCGSCEELQYETRCPIDHNLPLSLYPGDLNKMFRRILNTNQQNDGTPDTNDTNNKNNNITARVLSRPDLADDDTAETRDYEVGGPWMILFENFASPEECQALIEEGAFAGYERSLAYGDEDKETGEKISLETTSRTSSNTWCKMDECEQNPLVDSVMQRIETVTGIHRNYSEQLQLLRYEPGQFYQVHHDYIDNDQYHVTGSRILTLFIYLNDVEEGGATDFPDLGIRVQPKKGAALLWPSVLDEEPHKIDNRTSHQALPVIQGVKYGANAWLHQRQFRPSFAYGC